MDGPVGTSRSAKANHWNCRWASRFGVTGKSIPSVSANLLSQAVGDAEYALECGGLRATGFLVQVLRVDIAIPVWTYSE